MLDLHVDRYRFASRYVPGKRVLDLACGSGFGSAILAEAGAASVTGVDISEPCVRYARSRYAKAGVEYRQCDGMTFAPDAPLDIVVSLETIEHVVDAEGFVRRLTSFLRAGGMLIGSVPTTFSTDVNPYHLHDISAAQFRRLFKSLGFEIVAELEQDQPFSPFGLLSLRSSSGRGQQIRKGLVRYYARHPDMAARRLWTTLSCGFRNKYLVIAGRKTA